MANYINSSAYTNRNNNLDHSFVNNIINRFNNNVENVQNDSNGIN